MDLRKASAKPREFRTEAFSTEAAVGSGLRPAPEILEEAENRPAPNLPVSGAQRRVGEAEIRKATHILNRYKEGKARLDARLVESEEWWKLRHWQWMENKGNAKNPRHPSAWLFNVLINKHADAIQNFPQPNILPRESADKKTAATLSAVVPLVLEQNDFEEVYSDVSWNKLKQGTGIYGVFWDGSKLGGLGDIAVREIEPLNLFWEPGITDIQESANVFHVELVDKEALMQRYPQLEGKLNGESFNLNKYVYDDSVRNDDKAAVIDWYYHTHYDGETKLHYCKFVGNTLLYASENDTEPPTAMQAVQIGTDMRTGEPVMEMREAVVGKSVAETGWYAHGQYPFIFDRLFPVKGSPFGFGYVDVCKHAQEQIDLLNQALTMNALMNAMPRYMKRDDANVNEKQFADWTQPFVNVSGSLDEMAIKPIVTPTLDASVMTVINNKITEMKETTGNTDASNGVTNGVTSASGIAAQQQASGKTSRASNMSAYRAFSRMIYQVIELIRQFYTAPRMFRITGDMGQEEYVAFDNSGMQPQKQGNDFGMDMGMRKPVFDVKVSAQSKNVYTQNAQNEMATALYGMGVFNPQMTDQSLMLLDMMDFEGKDEIMAKVSRAGTVYQMFAQVAQVALGLAQKYDPAAAEALSQILMQHAGGVMTPAAGAVSAPEGDTAADVQADPKTQGKEIAQVRRARENAGRAAEVQG